MSKVKVKLKEGVGGFLRLTDPGFSFTIRTGDEVDVDIEVFNKMQQYLEKVKPKPRVTAKSEVKSLDTFKDANSE